MKNNQEPEFAKSFEFDFYFEREQIIKVEVYDDDGGSGDFIGYFEANVGQIMTSMGCKLTGELLKDGKAQNRGQVTLRAEIPSRINARISFNMSASVRSQAGCCSSDAPFVQIFKKVGADYMKVLETRTANSNTPVFERVDTTGLTLLVAGNEENTELQFKILNYKQDGNHGTYA